LKLPLDVLVVRKIGHPLQREFAVGALAEPDVFILDEMSVSNFPLDHSELESVVAEETARLGEYRARFRHASAPSLKDKTVLLVDDGLATGTTAAAAVVSARHQNARRIIVAAPVASTNALEKLQRSADEFVALVIDSDFAAVGQYYNSFFQTTDEEVIELLKIAPPRPE
jgi:putative phosphoribosyl transferase